MPPPRSKAIIGTPQIYVVKELINFESESMNNLPVICRGNLGKQVYIKIVLQCGTKSNIVRQLNFRIYLMLCQCVLIIIPLENLSIQVWAQRSTLEMSVNLLSYKIARFKFY